MEVLRVFNNNVVLARTPDKGEVILTGRGLGFQAKPGKPVDESKVIRVFVPEDGRDADNFGALVAAIPPEHLLLADEALQIARKDLPNTISSTTVVGLADHISFAIKRIRQGIDLEYPLRGEVSHLYPEELRQPNASLISSIPALNKPCPRPKQCPSPCILSTQGSLPETFRSLTK